MSGTGSGATAINTADAPDTNLKWVSAKSVGESPGKRHGHTFTIVGTNAYMFGGCDTKRPPGPVNTVHVLRISANGPMEWANLPVTGAIPPARWQHSAVVANKTRVIVFGGLHSSAVRLNDVWELDTVRMAWSCLHHGERPPVDGSYKHIADRDNEAAHGTAPPDGASAPEHVADKAPGSVVGGDAGAENTIKGTPPSPRGGHSATVVGSLMFVFGGYGGIGYGRRDFNDLYTYDMIGMGWEKVLPKGTPPEPRCGHAAVAVEARVFVSGGWSNCAQFNDLHTLDTETMTWAKILEHGTPRWNHGMVCVKAIPHPKLFIFGGCTGDLNESQKLKGEYSNTVMAMDTGALRWVEPELVGDVPAPRDQAPIAYEPKSSRIVFFGGWSNRWHGDLCALDVGSVVGPPYAVTGIHPEVGAITGGQTITVYGLEFFESGTATVRFAGRTGSVDVPAIVKSATTLTCVAPSFEQYGPGEVDVRVALGSESFTTTFSRFSFFAVTDGKKSLAYGPGLLQGGLAGHPTEFLIEARDSTGRRRVNGGDEFQIRVISSSHVSSSAVTADVHDLNNGLYRVKYTPPSSGSYSVNIQFKGTFSGTPGPVWGSPFSAGFKAGVSAAANTMGGPLVLKWVKDNVEEMEDFVQETRKGINAKISDGTTTAVVAVKEHIHNVEKESAPIEHKVATLRALLTHLEQDEGIANAAPLQDSVNRTASDWKRIQDTVPSIRSALQPLVRKHGQKAKQEVVQYERECDTYAKAMRRAPFWESIPVPQAKGELERAQTIQAERMQDYGKRLHLAEMLEFAETLQPAREILDRVATELDWAVDLWNVAEACGSYFTEQRNTLWADLVPDEMEEDSKRLQRRVRGLPREVRWSAAFTQLDQSVKEFMAACPLIAALRHPAMRERHWEELQQVTHKTFTPPYEDPELRLKEILALELHLHASEVEEITDKAQKEAKIERNLAKLEETWSAIDFKLEETVTAVSPAAAQAGGKARVSLVSLSADDTEVLEADQLTVQGMLGSRFLAFFEPSVRGWHRDLAAIGDVSQLLAEIQRSWAYLGPLFIKSDEVKRELPTEAARFEHIDVQIRDVLKSCNEVMNVRKACTQAGLMAKLEKVTELLEMCKKALTEFLDGKRQKFPRFYFVSEADLLDILSNASNPSRIMKHISKVFLATEHLMLDSHPGGESDGEADGDGDEEDSPPNATHFVAGVGSETIEFHRPVPLSGRAEEYLQRTLDSMCRTLQRQLDVCATRYPSQARTTWLLHDDKEAAQVRVLVGCADYVSGVEESLDRMEGSKQKDALSQYHDVQKRQLSDLIRLTRTDLSKGQRRVVMVMITLDAHGRDIVDRLLKEGVESKKHFLWQSQLKQRLSATRDSAKIEIADAAFDYGFEYLGNGARLVVTPLTDRIYVTATQALNLKMGCAPAGPAGTGKTETTKDLAAALGKVCYVFNCSPEMDYQSMGNIFKGLAASGAWGCFDEFNRLIPEVLSVCSVQFKAVCDAVRHESSDVTIEGDTVKCDWTVGVFITMNPGYLGRSELPEGLKSLFRPITVMVPDLVLICENMLMAEGFEDAKVLASKFYGLYSLLRDLLSKQSHYDWGLRAVKSVLVVAGVYKRAEPDLSEQALLMRALRDMNTPKIVQSDEIIFHGLLGDLFPNVDPPRKLDEDLEDSVQKACISRGLWPDDAFRLKVVQLQELLQIRHCVFVMGSAASGKSECWKTLARALDMKRSNVRDINPKAVTTEELYGYVTLKSREWRDGVLSKTMRDLGEIADKDPKWIVLDGDLDANWIESMNSVMDDNKMLTLASNERVPLKPHMRMLFEIRDLRFATPATVSRAGILYISDDRGHQWQSLLAAWVRSKTGMEEHVREALQSLFDAFVPTLVRFLEREAKTIVPVPPMACVQTLLYMLEGLLTPALLAGAGEVGAKSAVEDAAKHLETTFSFAAVWAFGSSMATMDGVNYREAFTEFYRANFKANKFPSRETVFDYWLDPASQKFEPWKKAPFFYTVDFDPKTMPMGEVTVPTSETSAVTHWLDLLVLQLGRPVMLAGLSGCGKTQLMQGVMSKLDPATHKSATVGFNYFTTSHALQGVLDSYLERKSGSNYGPVGNGKLLVLFDDLNLPEVDAYDTQSAIAVIRQIFDYHHFYDMTKIQTRNILGVQYVSAMNPTAGSFTVNPRLQRHFATFAIDFPSPTSLLTIYQTFLSGHLKDFSGAIQATAGNLINAALDLHSKVSQTFRKSAVNFHYEFSVRHLSNVFQGLLVAQPREFKSTETFVQLWAHESERVYGDRLVNADDLAKFRGLLLGTAKKRLAAAAQGLGRYLETAGGGKKSGDRLLFSHFAGAHAAEGAYAKVNDINEVRRILNESMQEYSDTVQTMELVLFDDAVAHVCRLARIFMNPGGHALVVGVGGSGKRSLTRLSAFVCGFSVQTITVSTTYSTNDLLDDLRDMYTKAGVKGDGILFLFTDSQITDERFLVYLNDLLASGNIPDLFAVEDKDNIVGTLTTKAKALGLPTDRESVWAYFMSQVRNNLHVALCFSPVGDAFRTRCLRFPALVTCTVIDWFQPWPEEALLSVASSSLASVDMVVEGDEQQAALRSAVETFMPFSVTSVNETADDFLRVDRRRVYNTPKSFLSLLQLFQNLMQRKRQEIDNAIDRLTNGLTKLRNTATEAAEMEEQLGVLLQEASTKKAKAEAIAAEVKTEKETVERETEKAGEEERKCAKMAADVQAQQRECEGELAKAEPMVERAMQALDTLDRKDLSMCKTMSTPPPGVDDIFIAVQVLLAGVDSNVQTDRSGLPKDRTWSAIKKQLLGNIAAFMDSLKGYKDVVESGNVPPQNMREIRKYLELEHFDVEVISKKNSAAGGLTAFVQNVVRYYDVVQRVQPLREALAEANKSLEEANTQLGIVQENVARLQAELDKLTANLAEAEGERKAAEDEVAQGQAKLDLAQRLTRALADENERWAQGIERFKSERAVLVGDVLLASAFISYIGPFSKRFRSELMGKWQAFMAKAMNGEAIPMSPDASPLMVLTDDAEIAQWNNEGLPSDVVSLENGAICRHSMRWPLMVDPQLQGIKWIKEHEARRSLHVRRQNAPDLMQVLEAAVENGEVVLLENLGEAVDAVLMPLVARATFKRGKREFIKLGESDVPLNPKFRLYLHTKLSNPHYPPEIQAECTLVNFAVTEDGLEDQLLALVVEKERPDLAKQKTALIQQSNKFTVEIKKLENEILERLANAQGVITEDVELIESLERAKRISNEISEKAKIAKDTTAQINETSEKYRPVSARGSLLFFLMNELNKVHTYYIYSLAAFVATFTQGIATTPHAEGVRARGGVRVLDDEQISVRCTNLKTVITKVVFNYLRRGLFQRDTLTIATQLCLQVLGRDGKVSEDAILLLKTCPRVRDPGSRGPVSDWLSELLWSRLKGLERVPELKSLGEDMQTDTDAWEAWFDLELPEASPMPGKYKKLSSFAKLLILRALRPDRLVSALTDFVGDELGREFVEQSPLNMEAAYAETSPATPVFFVLFPGVDPTVWVEELGKKHGFTLADGSFINISMGQGQEEPAEAALQKCAQEGGWVMLQNCHLMQSWLPRLERTLELCAENAHPGFRCFLSAEPPPLAYLKNMPESLMQNCVKIANEAPADLKSNLRRAWAMFDADRIKASRRPHEFQACLFTLCAYHSLVLGRRRFGQTGWSRAYSFNQGDLTVCANVLFKYLDEAEHVPWDDLRYIFGEIMYGGHITDAWDRRTNNAYLEVLFQESIFREGPILPSSSFKALPLDSELYTSYADHVADLPMEGPQLFGLHPNAEIGYLTNTTKGLFNTILSLEGIVSNEAGDGEDEDEAGAAQGARRGGKPLSAAEKKAAALRALIKDLKARTPPPFKLAEVHDRAEDLLKEEAAPFVVVVLQECSRMNVLTERIRDSLEELQRGMNGELNMSEPMENLSEALSLGEVPGRNPFHKQSWEKLAWWSRKPLLSWFDDMLLRVQQLEAWVETLELPKSLWLPGLFNPTALLTAVQQVTARRRKLPLDNMTVSTHVTAMLSPDAVKERPDDGCFVHGLMMQGARWLDPRDAGEPELVNGVPCAGHIIDARLKELLAPMPVVYVQAVQVQPDWLPSSVGYLRQNPAVYDCPVYTTTFRGPTYVFLATLKSEEPLTKWTLAGAAIVMQDDN